MSKVIGILISGCLCAFGVAALTAQREPPAPWAFGFTDPPPPPGTSPAGGGGRGGGAPASAPDTTQHTVPGTDVKLTRQQVDNRFNIGDWFPNDHPTMPSIVQYGKAPAVWACGSCHMVNGKGHPDNAPVSGLPVAYFVQQLNDFKNDLRKSADPRKADSMVRFAKGLTEEDMRASAEYYAQIPWNTPWVKVVEATTVPKTRSVGGIWMPLENDETEPLGNRIMEMPVSIEATELRDDHNGSFIAYVPQGSIKKGEAVATSGAKVTQCSVCHGANQQGLGPIPGLAGRSPSYLARELYDMRDGTRKGPWVSLMKPVVDKMSGEDILNVVAYLASIPVGPARQ